MGYSRAEAQDEIRRQHAEQLAARGITHAQWLAELDARLGVHACDHDPMCVGGYRTWTAPTPISAPKPKTAWGVERLEHGGQRSIADTDARLAAYGIRL